MKKIIRKEIGDYIHARIDGVFVEGSVIEKSVEGYLIKTPDGDEITIPRRCVLD